MRSLPGCRQQALDRIERTLVAEDPGLGLRFAVFTRLTLHEAMPGTEQVQSRLQRLLGPVIRLPLLVISLAGLLAGSWLIPSAKVCTVGAEVPARSNPR